MKRILVVANQTLCEQHLLDELRRRRQDSAASFHFVVPATHPSGWTWSEGQAEVEARARLGELLDTLAVGGIAATGEIGDASPVTAVDDVLRRESFDEIIVSTLPVGMSRWLAGNVVRRMRSHTGLPVTHVVSERVPAGG
jgi:nucleotide-binding universal stress UspA family protein